MSTETRRELWNSRRVVNDCTGEKNMMSIFRHKAFWLNAFRIHLATGLRIIGARHYHA
jgi:hypothetical protein